MKFALARIVTTLACLAGLAGCVVYDPYYPAPQVSPQQACDRSWNAALSAMRDQGVQVTNENRGAGQIDGRRGDVAVRARVVTQADGKVRVEISTSGGTGEGPALAQRISNSYDTNMGR